LPSYHQSSTSTNTTSWSWDFGDSDTTNNTLENPLHTYSTSDLIKNYTITLSTNNTYGSGIPFTRADYISIYNTPTSGFTFTPASGSGTFPLSVSFTDTSTSYNPISWSWNFGDGSTSTSQNPTHTFATAGTFTVTLIASNVYGAGTTSTQSYTVNTPIPVTNFEGTPLNGSPPLTVSFTDLSTNIPTIWLWNFGDGDSTNSTQQDPIHTYASPGNFTVSLTSTNAGGSSTETKTDYIQTAIIAIPDFTWATVAGRYPYAIFTETHTGTPVSYLWDFGDGSSLNTTEQNPIHTYVAAGTYNVSLTTFNIGGSYKVDKTVIIPLPNWDFPIIGFLSSIMGPFTHAFSGVGVGSGNIVFLILFGIFIMMVWRQSGKVTIPAIIAVITASGWAMLMPESAFPWVQLLLTFAIVAQVLGWIAKE
jgi:PKD repeat protein